MGSGITTVEVDRVERPTRAELRRILGRRLRPVVVTGLADAWPMFGAWTRSALRARPESLELGYIQDGNERGATMLETAARRRRGRTDLADLLDGLDACDAPRRYVIKADVSALAPDLARQAGELQSLIPLPRPLARRFSTGPFLWLGPAGVTSPLHVEREHNLFLQTDGHKEWLLIGPRNNRDVYFPWPDHPDDLFHWSPVDLAAPDPQRFPRFFALRPLRALLQPGDLLFVPAGWWHCVRYPDASISVNVFWRDARVALACAGYFAAGLRRRLLRRLGLGTLVPRLERAAVRPPEAA